VLMAGLDGIKFDLVSVAGRRIDEFDITKLEWNKDTRDQFHKATRDFLFTDEHIKYNAIDSYVLPYIYEKQQHLAEANNQLFLINSLRSRSIKPLAEAERTGFVHNSEKWREITKKRIEEAKELSEQMDDYIAERKIHVSIINPEVAKKLSQRSGRESRLRERLEKTRNKILELESKNKTHLKSYQTLKELYPELMNQLDTVVNQPTEKARVNWGSSKQALEVFRRLGVKLPQKKDNTTHEMKAGVSKEARTNWMVENMDSEHYQFMELFDKYKRVSHNISAFGEKWIEKYVRSNGKAYTTFRQASTATLRLASGNADAGLFNLQQIPSRDGPEYRECFGTDPGRGIIVLDYVGCELVCMISLSKDLDLKRISELPDQHSYLGTKCWRAVYLDRYNRTKDQKWLELANSYEMDASTPAKKKERTKFKESGAFPVVYGVSASKVAAIQGFSKHEGQIFIDTIESEMPNVISFVKLQAQKALRDGYVIHNDRTNSRRLFSPVIDHNLYVYEMTRGQLAAVESAARNTCIQGTNADIVIEAMCLIDLWKRLYKQDIRLLGQVHDELIYDCPIDKLDFYAEKIEQLMIRAAKNYLIPEIDMKVDVHKGLTWTK